MLIHIPHGVTEGHWTTSHIYISDALDFNEADLKNHEIGGVDEGALPPATPGANVFALAREKRRPFFTLAAFGVTLWDPNVTTFLNTLAPVRPRARQGGGKCWHTGLVRFMG